MVIKNVIVNIDSNHIGLLAVLLVESNFIIIIIKHFIWYIYSNFPHKKMQVYLF